MGGAATASTTAGPAQRIHLPPAFPELFDKFVGSGSFPDKKLCILSRKLGTCTSSAGGRSDRFRQARGAVLHAGKITAQVISKAKHRLVLRAADLFEFIGQSFLSRLGGAFGRGGLEFLGVAFLGAATHPAGGAQPGDDRQLGGQGLEVRRHASSK